MPRPIAIMTRLAAGLFALTSVNAFAADAMIQAYKRNPLPIFDNAGAKIDVVDKAKLPKPNTPGARVISSKPGYVAIIIDGKPSWLRLTTVDYVGDLPVPKCEKGAIQLAMLEEDGIERSLGLGCDGPKGKQK
jgi:hypothetical protein